MDEKKVADKIRGINWERWARDILDWKWWLITCVILALIWPGLFPVIMIGIGFSIAHSLRVREKRKAAKKDKVVKPEQ